MKRVGIIGAGASGMLAAIRLAKDYGVKVILIEKNDYIGKKLLSTGNGRCNITNSGVNAADYDNERAAYALNKYSAEDTISYFRELGLIIKSTASGECYPHSESAKDVLAVLTEALLKNGVKIITGYNAERIDKSGDSFFINQELELDALIIAVGSRAGIKGYNGYNLFKSASLEYKKFFPALCSLPLAEKLDLKGIRAKTTVRFEDKLQSGQIQFGADYVSGICVMNISKYIKEKSFIYADFAPSISKEELIEYIKNKPTEGLAGLLDKRLAKAVINQSDFTPEGIAEAIKSFRISVLPAEDFKSAQVCSGGIEIFNPETMESSVKGIFLCGEELDVDGMCGGFNLQWAWSSAMLAADGVYKYLGENND